MASSVTEGQIKKLRKAGYLSYDIAHRLPDEGQLIPTPRPHERVVFLTHFLRGLGFPLHPFVRGLMFYYGLDFHDLAPNFILNISAFIVVCEAFLRITPHFGLWLKTFEVKSKMIEGQQAACGGASIGKMAGAPWPKGSFPEVSELWQREWFYVTAPKSAKWAADPAFRPGPPPQLMSWISRGLSWGPAKDVHLRSLQWRFYFGCGNTSYAGSSSPALQTPAPSLVGVQPRRSANYPTLLRHDT